MRAGEMPPKAAPQPASDQVIAAADCIETTYAQLDRTQPVDPGSTTARRLNRSEYANSVRDLLGIDMLPSEELPAAIPTATASTISAMCSRSTRA